jgi:chromate reductase
MKLLGVVGSLRRASVNRALLRELVAVLPDGVSLDTFDDLGAIPPFDSDLPAEPPAVTALKQAIGAAHGLVIACPEYNYSVPGVLKNALDWVSRPPATSPLRGKPVGILGATIGMSGTIRAQAHLRQILLYSDAPVLGQPEVLIPKADQRFDASLRLIDESTRGLLRGFGAALVDHVDRYTRAIRPAPTGGSSHG